MRLLTRIHHYAGKVFYFFPNLKFSPNCGADFTSAMKQGGELPVPVLADAKPKEDAPLSVVGGEARESMLETTGENKRLSDSRGGQNLHIVAAAIRDHDGQVYSLSAPKRHGHVIWHMADLGIKTPITGKQGFVTNEGGFVDRETAALIALHAGQIQGHRRELFSEDLW